jgi:hypothetical protein
VVAAVPDGSAERLQVVEEAAFNKLAWKEA